jgi:hypothetical protein
MNRPLVEVTASFGFGEQAIPAVFENDAEMALSGSNAARAASAATSATPPAAGRCASGTQENVADRVIDGT